MRNVIQQMLQAKTVTVSMKPNLYLELKLILPLSDPLIDSFILPEGTTHDVVAVHAYAWILEKAQMGSHETLFVVVHTWILEKAN